MSKWAILYSFIGFEKKVIQKMNLFFRPFPQADPENLLSFFIPAPQNKI
jgi:hypothetical protein